MHIAQPWFPGKIFRDSATDLVQKYRAIEGVFLVRQSRSAKNNFAITYIFNQKVLDVQVQTVKEHKHKRYVFTIDNHRTRFYHFLQLMHYFVIALTPDRMDKETNCSQDLIRTFIREKDGSVEFRII